MRPLKFNVLSQKHPYGFSDRCQIGNEFSEVVDCTEQSFNCSLVSWCIGLDPLLCKFVTNVGHFLDFEDTFSLV